MAASIILWEAANIFVGDDGPNNSKHLTLENIKLPEFKEKTQEHHAGGAMGALSIGGLGFEPLDVTFKLMGVDAQSKAKFGLGVRGSRPYTIYGALRDKNGGRVIERKAILFGRMTEMSESEFEHGKTTNQDHKITEITHYELYEDKQEIFYFDFWTSQWRVGGVDQVSAVNAALRIA